MGRVVSVGFETESAESGGFTIPRTVADFLRLRQGDEIELSVLSEGRRVELSTRLGAGLEVVHRPGDAPTSGLLEVPAGSPITVTVWRPDAPDAAPAQTRVRDRTSFVEALVDAGLDRAAASAVLDACLEWASTNGLYARWGDSRAGSILIRLDDDRFPANVGRCQRFFALWTSGAVELQFQKMAPPFETAEARDDLRRRLDGIDGIGVARSKGYPSIPVAALADEHRRSALLAVFSHVLEESGRWLERGT